MQLTDVTVREASQMPGRSYDAEQRIEAGRAIDRLGVARIQSGFPAVGDIDHQVTETLSEETDAPTVAIARAIPSDVEAALTANAEIIEVFAPVSDAHLDKDLHTSREEVFQMFGEAIDTASDGGAIPRIGVLDAFRTDPEHLVTLFDRFDDVVEFGLADTVGRRSPRGVGTILSQLVDHIDPGRLGVHFHNDLGVGVANVLAAKDYDVGWADVSIAALGERVGNPALEEVVAAGVLEHSESFGIDEKLLIPVARDVLAALGEEVSPRKPILGEEAVRHEAGIHTAAMLDDPSLFEPFDPSRFGGQRTLVFGDGTGRGGAKKLLAEASVSTSDSNIDELLTRLAEEGPLDHDAARELARTIGD